jgi:hypothetical protein
MHRIIAGKDMATILSLCRYPRAGYHDGIFLVGISILIFMKHWFRISSFYVCYKFYNSPKKIRSRMISIELPISRMSTMRKLIILLSLLLAGVIIIMPITATAATAESPNASPTQSSTRTLVIPEKVTIPPGQTTRPPSGEVVVPITRHITPTPTIPRTTIPATPTILRTTTPVTPTILKTTVSATPTISQTTVSATQTILKTTVSATPTISQTTVSATQTILKTTVSATQTVSKTTVPVTQTTTQPVVTVTVIVYRSGPVYRPVYYYPAGYPYDSRSYYPPNYPYDVNSYYSSGSLTVTSNPSEATVIVDGYDSETTPYVFTGLTTGYHTVEVDYPGYEAYVTNVYIDNGASVEVNADLNWLDSSYGSLFIDSNPKGADVYVDGNYQGTSPVSVGAMSVGAHQVELHLVGYEVLTATENVAAGQGTVVNLAMVPYSSLSDSGSLDITSNPPGALVYLDGIYKGFTQTGDTFSIVSVNPGSHTILLHLPGYTDFTQTVQVNAGQISNVYAGFTVQQSPTTSAQATGSIVATSSPSGGQVYVDNQLRGATPITIYNVATGTRIIDIKLAGYSDWSSSVGVSANQIAQVSATLTPVSGTPVPTRAGLSPVAIIGALALGAVVLSSRFRR